MKKLLKVTALFALPAALAACGSMAPMIAPDTPAAVSVPAGNKLVSV